MNLCERYTGLSCVDGSCPIANREEYEERCIPVIDGCKDCHLCKGCEDCIFDSTEYCKEVAIPKT